MSAPSNRMRPAVDVDEPQQRAPERRLARAAFADDADGFAAADPQADALQDFDARRRAAEQTFSRAEDDVEIVGDENFAGHGACRSARRRRRPLHRGSGAAPRSAGHIADWPR